MQDFNIYGNYSSVLYALINLFKNSIFWIREANQGKIIIKSIVGKLFNTLIIIDTAIGCNKNTLKLVKKGLSTRKGGHGQGLQLCKHALSEVGSNFYIESNEGKEFIVYINFPKAI